MDVKTRRQLVCPECGAKLPDGAKFCGDCGAQVA
ncbi:MAG TPA: zinc ribbon domain-containing protein [Coriobacteriia bacterium]|jgi:ribosomal protein L40E